MKVRLLTCIITVFLILFSFKSYSQENPIEPGQQKRPILVGPVFGYNKSMHSVELLTFDDPTKLCKPFDNGGGNGFYAGLSFEYLFGDPAKSISSIIVRALYNTMPAFMERIQDDYPTLVQTGPNTNAVIQTTTKHEANVTYSMFTVEACYKINPIPNVNLGITVGPTFDFPITKTINQTYKLVGDPLNAQFYVDTALYIQRGYKISADGRTITIQDGPIPNATGFRLGLKIGVQYEIIPGEKWFIVPAIYYNLGITKVTSAENWRINALQLGVDIRYALKLFGS